MSTTRHLLSLLRPPTLKRSPQQQHSKLSQWWTRIHLVRILAHLQVMMQQTSLLVLAVKSAPYHGHKHQITKMLKTLVQTTFTTSPLHSLTELTIWVLKPLPLQSLTLTKPLQYSLQDLQSQSMLPKQPLLEHTLRPTPMDQQHKPTLLSQLVPIRVLLTTTYFQSTQQLEPSLSAQLLIMKIQDVERVTTPTLV